MTATECRRCDRPLKTEQSRRREIGPKCERLEAAERAGHARRPPSRPGELDQVLTGFPALGQSEEDVVTQGKEG